MKDTINGVIEKKVSLVWLITIVFAVFAWGLRLEFTVDAMYDKGAKLRAEVESEVKRSKDLDELVLQKLNILENNQIKIMTSMGIEP